jgi:hypothetical protein
MGLAVRSPGYRMIDISEEDAMSTRSTCAKLLPKPTDGQQALSPAPAKPKEPPRPQCLLLRGFQTRQLADRLAGRTQTS